MLLIIFLIMKVLVSDPSRTIFDFLIDPRLEIGPHLIIYMFSAYLKSTHRNIDFLSSYAKQTHKGAVFKRLGYLLEYCKSSVFNVMKLCNLLKSDGYIKFDPRSGGDMLVTRWGIWVQE